MTGAKSYFQDRMVLLLLSVNIFLGVLAILSVLFRLQGAGGNGYIVQCRDCSNPNALTKFTRGDVVDILSFVGFAAIVVLIHATLSWRTYHIRRQLSLAILALGILLLVLGIVVSSALLILR